MTDLEKANNLELYRYDDTRKVYKSNYVLRSHRDDSNKLTDHYRKLSCGETLWDDVSICYFYYPDEYSRDKTFLTI